MIVSRCKLSVRPHLKWSIKNMIDNHITCTSLSNRLLQEPELADWNNSTKRHISLFFVSNQNFHLKTMNDSDYHCTLEEWQTAKPFKDIPGPKPYPIIGNTWRFIPVIGEYGDMMDDTYKSLKRFHRQFGNIMRLEKIASKPASVVLFDPNDIEKVYKLEGILPERDVLPSQSYYRQYKRQDIFKNAKGLITSNGKDWYDFRNKVNSIMMQPKITTQYIHPVIDIAGEFVSRIKSIRKKDDRINGDFRKETYKWALESIAYLGLNTRLGCLYSDLQPGSLAAEMIQITEDIFHYGFEVDFKPSLWKYISTPAFKKAMKAYDDYLTTSEILIKKAIQDINVKKNYHENDSSAEPSVLEKLLKIDYDVAFVMALDMLLAGVDTTTTSVVNLFYYLAINQSKQEELRKEILSFLPNKNSVLTIRDLNSMHYLKACIKETVRMYPEAPGIIRVLTKNAVLSGYQIPKKTLVFFSHMFISLQEDQFQRPWEFLPERWLRKNIDSDISYKKAHSFSTMRFGFGSRACVGKRFAELEVEVAAVEFFRNFKISWIGDAPKRKTTSINYLAGPFHFVFEDL